jgi:hypothetical protein
MRITLTFTDLTDALISLTAATRQLTALIYGDYRDWIRQNSHEKLLSETGHEHPRFPGKRCLYVALPQGIGSYSFFIS